MEDCRNVAPTNVCPECGAFFACGMNAGQATCWCVAYPPLLAVPVGPAGSCYCPDCLRKKIEAELGAGSR